MRKNGLGNENGPREQVGAEGTARQKNKGRESRRQERKLQGIREQQEAWDTNVAWLKKAEVRKTAEDGCHGVEWKSKKWSGYREDQRWQMKFARNQSGGKAVCLQQSQTR